MTDRMALARDFLRGTDWAGADTAPLAGDASNRRYLRVSRGMETAVLMDAPPERGEDVRPFIAVGQRLLAAGLSPPRILAQDTDHGFLLLEDLGDDLFARIIPQKPKIEPDLYRAATDVLVHLHRQPLPEELATYDAGMMADKAALAFEWYAGAAQCSAAHEAVLTALSAHADDSVLIQRDYHAENLLWLPGRDGVARVGLLDFQDAMRGHPAYDLVSLLQDARRDVPPAIAADMLAYYIAQTGQEQDRFTAAYHVLGAQRNLRIIGVFARLCLRDGKAHYIDLIPRVWGHLMHDLDHPALADVAPFIIDGLPAPSDAFLRDLKNRCATSPLL
ncbi:aminoglycoside phosphotransferase family protein [Roseovarius arcticus]|uniref:aminoglycoside phosphotransferase family protein n=1 Tax=Roseovarius arcticus TaxID=2547404 RepID=UPI0011109873|nr:phosphotransferase [Roseovarius arcticus]